MAALEFHSASLTLEPAYIGMSQSVFAERRIIVVRAATVQTYEILWCLLVNSSLVPNQHRMRREPLLADVTGETFCRVAFHVPFQSALG